jgi:hypothetical protein
VWREWYATLIPFLILACCFVAPEFAKAQGGVVPPRQFHFNFDSNTPVKDLLPTPPKASERKTTWLNEELAKVPELSFSAPLQAIDPLEETAYVIAKINHLNAKQPDGFMKALINQRHDLRGLPFRLGTECRTPEHEALVFASAVGVIRHSSQMITNRINARAKDDPSDHARPFWQQFPKFLEDEWDLTLRQTRHRDTTREQVERANVAALMQMHTPRTSEYRVGMTKYLATIPNAEASRALVKLALFSSEETVHAAAIAGLKSRPAKEYADDLLQGLSYPLSAVSRRAANALVKLERKELLANLVGLLEQSDPRLPSKQLVDGKEKWVVREVVRVNHQRNCLLCHAPANTPDVPKNTLKAAVSLPGDPPQSSEGDYRPSPSPDILVRLDITYLRQDFSLMMDVEDAKPSGAKQRYDFFVRSRTVTATEQADFDRERANFKSPVHDAALEALRGLTGRNTEPTAQAWRRLLNH